MRSQVLIAPARGVSPVISAQLDAALFNYYANNMTSSAPLVEKPRLQFAHIRSLYPRFQYTDIASHAAIVILPYQVHPYLPSFPTFFLCLFLIYSSSSPFSTLSLSSFLTAFIYRFPSCLYLNFIEWVFRCSFRPPYCLLSGT